MEIANYLRTGAAAARAGFTGALLGAATVFALAAAIVAGLSPAAAAGDGGVVLMYHRFGESDLPSTNIRLEQFEAHLAELQSGGYTVMPLDDMVRAWRAGTPLPDRAVAITIDDAFRSIYTHAWPRLRAAGFPFTVFVATDPVDQRNPNYMTWDQLRELTNEPVPNHLKRWWFCLGGTPAYLFVVQIVTGILLAMYYQPAPSTACT